MGADIAIVGGGLFGSVAAALLKEHGHYVDIYDRGEALAGSRAAACLMKPSWLTGIKAQADIGLRVLKRLYGLQTIQFETRVGKVDVHRVPPLRILGRLEYLPFSVEKVESAGSHVRLWHEGTPGFETYSAVLVAAGAWSGELVKMPKILPKHGACARFTGTCTPRITVWAPYKQAVSFNEETGVWFGDGTALQDYRPEHRQRLLRHALGHGLDSERLRTVTYGIRPYVEGHKNGYFAEVDRNVFVSSGGGKNGVVLAGYQAQQFLEVMNERYR